MSADSGRLFGRGMGFPPRVGSVVFVAMTPIVPYRRALTRIVI